MSQPQESPREKVLHFTKLELQEEAAASRKTGASAAGVLASPLEAMLSPRSGVYIRLV